MNPEVGKIYQGDCIEIMRSWPDECVDLIVTDPPYGVNYEGGTFNAFREKLANDDKNIYPETFIQLHRLLRRGGGGAYVFYAGSLSENVFPPNPFKKYQMLVWGKSNAKFAAMAARYKQNFEPFVWLQKPPTKWNGPSNATSLMWMPRESSNVYHPTQKPLDLMIKLIKNSSDEGQIVFDPFCGSGTTLLAAERLKRKWIGIEIEPSYVRVAQERLDLEMAQERLF